MATGPAELMPPDLKDCIFEVTRKFQYTQKKMLINQLTTVGLVPEEVFAEVKEDGPDADGNFHEYLLSHKSIRSKERNALMKLFRGYRNEKKTNESEYLQIVGDSILYGQTFQLRHVDTNKFLTIKRTAADVEVRALKVVLDEGGDEGSWFQVFSGYRTKAEGSRLEPGDVIALKGLAFSPGSNSQSEWPGLHVSSIRIEDIKREDMLPVEKNPYLTASKEVSAAPEVSAFKVIPFAVHERSTRLDPPLNERMRGMSSISIQDLVANTIYINFLGAYEKLDGEKSQKVLYFESPMTRKDPDRVSGPDCWRVELVEPEGKWCGMPVKHMSKVRIRHLPTGMYLAANSEKAKLEAKRSDMDRRGKMDDLERKRSGAGGARRKDGIMEQEEAPEAPEPQVPVTPGGVEQALRSAVATDADVLHEEGYRLVLTHRYAVPATTWQVYTVQGPDEPVGQKLYAFFKHVETGFWMSGAGPAMPADPNDDMDDDQEMQWYPIVHPKKLERNVMQVVVVPDDFTKKVMEVQRVAAVIRSVSKELKRTMRKDKLPSEEELIALVQAGEEEKALAVLGSTQYAIKFKTRHKALKRALRDLVYWLDKDSWADTIDSAPHAEYQAVFRELGLFELIVVYMEAARVRLFATSHKLRSHALLGKLVVDTGRMCHRILQLACVACEDNQEHMKKHEGMVQLHLSLPLTAPDTLAAIYEDNMQMMQNVSREVVQAAVSLIRLHGQQPRFINFLRQISGTRERPMPNNQNWIISEIVGKGRNPLEIFCRAGMQKRHDKRGQLIDTWIISCKLDGTARPVEEVDASSFSNDPEDLTKAAIKEWDLSGDEEGNAPRDLFIYYCYTLKFIVSLCYGRNSLVRDLILQASQDYGLGLEFDGLLAAIHNENLPFGLRSYMVQVMRALYLDVEPFQPLKLPRHIRMMTKSAADNQSVLGRTSTPEDMARINQLIVTTSDYLKMMAEVKPHRSMLDKVEDAVEGAVDGAVDAMKSMLDMPPTTPKGGNVDEELVIDDEERALRTVGRNTLLLNQLKLTRELFRFGMMNLDDKKTQDLLKQLLDIIQLVDAMPLDNLARFKRGYASKVVMDMKKTALSIIDFALDMKTELHCAGIFTKFGEWQRSPKRQAYWAKKRGTQQPKARSSGAGVLGLARAAGGFMGGIRSAATLAGNKVSPTPGPSSAHGSDPEAPPPKDGSAPAETPDDGMFDWVRAAEEVIARDNDEDDFVLFKLDTIDDKEPLYKQESSCIMKLLDLRLTSKREKLLGELMRTFVVTDEDLVALAEVAGNHIEEAQKAYNYMGSLDVERSKDACQAATKAIDGLNSLLMVHKHVITGPNDSDRVFVSRATAINCQFLLSDMQVHQMVIKFLKLPLKRKSGDLKNQLREVEDPNRKEVFRACLTFLRNFMVVGDLDGSTSCAPSSANQAAVLPSLELLLSFLDTQDLPASDTVIALFVKNQSVASKEGLKVIRTLLQKLIPRYGDKRSAGWLEMLSKVMVVDGQHIKRNQAEAMQRISQNEEKVLFLPADDNRDAELRGLLAVEKMTASPTADPPVGRLAYHTACVQLLADCCIGKEPELVVKASGYMSLKDVVDVLLLRPCPKWSAASLRYIQRGYWRLMLTCYFATDTDNTKVQVRDGSNRMWPLTDEAAADGGGGGGDLLMRRYLENAAPGGAGSRAATEESCSSLIQAVMDEVERAIEEPMNALEDADSATHYLVTAVFPALKEYFMNHWHGHAGKLAVRPDALLSSMFDKIAALDDQLKALKDKGIGQSLKSELKMARTSTRALLNAMPEECNNTGKNYNTKPMATKSQAPGKESAPSMSQTTAVVAKNQKAVQEDWRTFVCKLAEMINVMINPRTNEIVEVLHLNNAFGAAVASLRMEGNPTFEQASLLRMARLLAAPFGYGVAGSNPGMSFEDLIEMLCKLLGSRDKRKKTVGPSDWKLPLMVKMVRVIRGALMLDDGHGAEELSQMRDAWAHMGLLKVAGKPIDMDDINEPPQELVTWRQSKFDKLSATKAAVTLLAHSANEVQFEAMQLLEELLRGGNTAVQGTLFEIMKRGNDLSESVFANLMAVFEMCRKYVSKRDYTYKSKPVKKEANIVEDAAKVVAGAVGAVVDTTKLIGNKLMEGALALEVAVPGLQRTVDSLVPPLPPQPPSHQNSGRTHPGPAPPSHMASGLSNAGPPSGPGSRRSSNHGGGSPADPMARQDSVRSNVQLPGETGAGAEADPEAAVPPPPPLQQERSASRLDKPPSIKRNSLSIKERTSRSGALPPLRRSNEGGEDTGYTGPGPIAEGVEDAATTQNGPEEADDEDEEEMQWQDKPPRLNHADSPYEFCKLVLSVLRQMVEGHYTNLQKLLQRQPNTIAPGSNVDLLMQAVDLFNVLQDYVGISLEVGDSEVADLMMGVCMFVQEMVQGPCESNQAALAATSFLAVCNRIFDNMRYTEEATEKAEKMLAHRRAMHYKCAIKTSVLNLLISLLEHSEKPDIPDRCADILEFANIEHQIEALCRVLGMNGDLALFPTEEDQEEWEAGHPPEDHELCGINKRLSGELLLLCGYVLKLNSVRKQAPGMVRILPYIDKLYQGEDVEKMEDELEHRVSFAADLQAFLRKHLGYVEIQWGSFVEPCFFTLTAECSELVDKAVWTKVTLDRLHNTVSPDSRQFHAVKAAELVEVLVDVVDDIELEAKLTQNKWLKVVSVLGQYRMKLLELTFYLAVATLIFQALADARWGPHTPFNERGQSWETVVLSVAVILQSTCTVLLYISMWYTDLNKHLNKMMPEVAEKLSNIAHNVRDFFNRSGGDDEKGGRGNGGGAGGKGGRGNDSAASAAPQAAVEKLKLAPPPEGRRRKWTDYIKIALSFIISVVTNGKFWYFSMLMAASFAGFFVSPFFLVFHFSIYFLDFDSGRQLVLAIQRSGINILNTFVLAVLAIYVFAVVTFLVFKDPTRVDKGDGPPCDTFYQCMGAHMLTGIMGDISNLFNSDLWDTVPEAVDMDGLQQARTIFVLFFFMIWNFVLSNIFVGLIASAFEAIRDDQNTITTDRLSRCLVCSIEMYDFNQKIEGGFDEHILHQHNPLMYVFFLHHLRATEKEDYTGAESIVSSTLTNAKTSTSKGAWLPVDRSLAIEHAEQMATQEKALADAANAKKDSGAGAQ
eukprot:XP_001701472.1 ryanodine-inositol 1,4,5-triphosphate receptor Ca2+ channel [Chlamydomonas reinhardtii]